tara:strand:+ start:44 stop:346 length:303 start_codon:yes stop_codon:yes gene_type:complete
MIDTDKYEGHTLNHPIHMDEPNPHDGGHREMLCDGGIVGWLQMDDYPSADVNAMLLADAPLLLEEVKRLREGIKVYLKITDERPHNYIHENREKLRELIE